MGRRVITLMPQLKSLQMLILPQLSTPGITICADTRRSLEELLLTRGRIHQCLNKINDLRECKKLKVMEIESDELRK